LFRLLREQARDFQVESAKALSIFQINQDQCAPHGMIGHEWNAHQRTNAESPDNLGADAMTVQGVVDIEGALFAHDTGAE